MRRSILVVLSMLPIVGLGASARAQYDEDFDETVQQSVAPAQQGVPAEGQPADPSVDFQTFHQALSPYGKWIYTTDYGWVWSPDGVSQDWQPYQDGEWVWTSYGWTWSGNEAWAWGPYHYGNWAYFGWGWGWVPGYVWGPAWVSWRYGPDYVGWTPLYPGWGYGVAWGVGWPIYYSQWCFVGYNNFYGTPINHATVLPASYVRSTVWNSTHSVGAVTVDGVSHVGPSPSQVQAATGHAVAPVPIRPISSVAQGSTVQGLHNGVFNAVAPAFRSAPQTFAQANGRVPSEISGTHAVGAQPVMAAQARAASNPAAYRGVLPGNPATQHFTLNGPPGTRVAQAPSTVTHPSVGSTVGGWPTSSYHAPTPTTPSSGYHGSTQGQGTYSGYPSTAGAAHPSYGGTGASHPSYSGGYPPGYAHPGYSGGGYSGGYHPAPASGSGAHPSMSGAHPSGGSYHSSGGGAHGGGGGGHR
jgi:hypothetical protein